MTMPPIPQGRLRRVTRDGEKVWQLCCPQCGKWGTIDEDQLHGDVSVHHVDIILGEEQCGFHETRDWFHTALTLEDEAGVF